MLVLLKLWRKMLNLPLHKTIKAVVFSIDGKVVLAIVRGDHEVNEVAVQHAVLGSVEPEMATPEELEKVGLTAGFNQPCRLTTNRRIYYCCR